MVRVLVTLRIISPGPPSGWIRLGGEDSKGQGLQAVLPLVLAAVRAVWRLWEIPYRKQS